MTPHPQQSKRAWGNMGALHGILSSKTTSHVCSHGVKETVACLFTGDVTWGVVQNINGLQESVPHSHGGLLLWLYFWGNQGSKVASKAMSSFISQAWDHKAMCFLICASVRPAITAEWDGFKYGNYQHRFWVFVQTIVFRLFMWWCGVKWGHREDVWQTWLVSNGDLWLLKMYFRPLDYGNLNKLKRYPTPMFGWNFCLHRCNLRGRWTTLSPTI